MIKSIKKTYATFLLHQVQSCKAIFQQTFRTQLPPYAFLTTKMHRFMFILVKTLNVCCQFLLNHVHMLEPRFTGLSLNSGHLAPHSAACSPAPPRYVLMCTHLCFLHTIAIVMAKPGNTAKLCVCVCVVPDTLPSSNIYWNLCWEKPAVVLPYLTAFLDAFESRTSLP